MEITGQDIDKAFKVIHYVFSERIREKGPSMSNSPHESLGICTEEYQELIEAVKLGVSDDMALEFIDLAVASIYGYISLGPSREDLNRVRNK